MTVLEAAGIVAVIVAFFKVKLIPQLWEKLPEIAKTAISVVACVGVTLFKYIQEQLPFNFGAVTFLVQLIVAVIGGYEFIKGMATALKKPQ